ncbi:MAG TPA: hypothetical protein PKW55_00805 [Spirochaetota bacterium]|nr:hypothetical protein [Spirochaetota bacterium]HOM39036.1 hypothetical protein [Spirochaetota bacterium]HPQ49911.1 hypothetical protein [Spirochaetota bacterium]
MKRIIYLLIIIINIVNTVNAEVKKNIIKRFGIDKPYFYYKSMGDMYRNKGDFENAIKNYEYAIILNEKCGECFYRIGEIKYIKGLYKEALTDLKSACEEDKYFKYLVDKLKAKYMLSTIYFELENDNLAIANLNSIINEYEELKEKSYKAKLINPRNYALAYFILGLYYRAKNRLDDQKIDYFIKSMQMNYKKDYCNYFLYEYYRAKEPDTAFRYLTQAILLNNNITKEINDTQWLTINNFKYLIIEYSEKNNNK